MLAQFEAFRGHLRVHAEEAGITRELDGELEFRSDGSFLWRTSSGGRRVELQRRGDSKLVKTVDGEVAALELGDEVDFALLWSVARGDPPSGPGLRTWENGFESTGNGRRLRVEWRAHTD